MAQRPLLLIGVLLAVLGAAALIWEGISYTTRETVVDVGPVNVTAETRKTLPLPPILGGLALAGGVGLIVMGTKKA